jgi:hypothetical protein
MDRVVLQAWTLEEVMGELGAAPSTLRACWRSIRCGGWRRTQRQRTAAIAASGPTTQARAVQQRCQARLAELGFAGLEAYLQDRYVSKAGRCGGCAPNSASAMAGWTSS